MSYQFEISYPAPIKQELQQKQADILRRFPQCQYQTSHTHPVGPRIDNNLFHSTIYRTNNPQDIVHVASSLKQADPRLFVAIISRGDKDIYYHPIKLTELTPQQRQHYIRVMEHLPQTERVLHDYIVNLYHNVPTYKEFQL